MNKGKKTNLETENISDKQKLELLHAYIKSLINDGLLPHEHDKLEEYFKTGIQVRSDADIIFKFISDLYGYSNFPEVVSDKEYQNIESEELFRGFRDIEHIANTIVSFDRHYGWGMISSGMHSTDNFDMALSYTCNETEYDKDLVLKFKLGSNKVTSVNKLQKELASTCMGNFKAGSAKQKLETLATFLNSVSNDNFFDTKLYVDMFTRDSGKLAIILGYDAITTGNFKSIAVLNRGKMIISKSEYDRILKNSKLYNDGFASYGDTQGQPST